MIHFNRRRCAAYHVDFPRPRQRAPDGFFVGGLSVSFTKSGIFPEFRDNHSRSVWLFFVFLIGTASTVFGQIVEIRGVTTKWSGRAGAHGSQSKACCKKLLSQYRTLHSGLCTHWQLFVSRHFPLRPLPRYRNFLQSRSSPTRRCRLGRRSRQGPSTTSVNAADFARTYSPRHRHAVSAHPRRQRSPTSNGNTPSRTSAIAASSPRRCRARRRGSPST